MDFTEKTIHTQEIFDGKIIRVKLDTVILPNGTESKRELVEHPGGVGIIAVNEKREVLVVTQYRKPFEEVVLEIPAGKLNWNENPFECCVRELEEETGYRAKHFVHLGEHYPTPGFCGEKINIYLATKLSKSEQKLDDDEFLDVDIIPLDKLYQMVMDNEIKDAKTVIAILKAKAILG